jgi:hypothetical protein
MITCFASPGLRADAAIGAIAVEGDLVALHRETFGRKSVDPAHAPLQVEEPLAVIAEKKVMMLPGRGFVVGRDTRYFDQPDLSFIDELLQGAINSGYPQFRKFFLRFRADIRRD